MQSARLDLNLEELDKATDEYESALIHLLDRMRMEEPSARHSDDQGQFPYNTIYQGTWHASAR